MRHEDNINPEDIVEEDRIDPRMVARGIAMTGKSVHDPRFDQEFELACVTKINNYDDTHSGIIVDPESGVLIRASRVDSSQAWSRAEADWNVRDVGSEIKVEHVYNLNLKSDDYPLGETEEEYVETWLGILFDEMKEGRRPYQDELDLNSNMLKVRDYGGREATVEISLE